MSFTNDRSRGLQTGHLLAGEEFTRLVERLRGEFDPGLADLLVEHAYGRVMSRPGLDLRDRALVAVAALAGLGAPADLRWHLKAALHAGNTPEEIREVMVQLIPYCGWAVALNALGVFRETLEEMKPGAWAGLVAVGRPAVLPETRQELSALGHENARRVNPQFERVALGIESSDPELLNHLTETAYGYVYGRPGLDLKRRELVAVALLTVFNQDPQLRYHIKGAVNVGATPEEVREVIIQMHLYAGWPACLSGLKAWREMVGGGSG